MQVLAKGISDIFQKIIFRATTYTALVLSSRAEKLYVLRWGSLVHLSKNVKYMYIKSSLVGS